MFSIHTCSFFLKKTAKSERKKKTMLFGVLKDKARGKMDCVRKRKKQLKF